MMSCREAGFRNEGEIEPYIFIIPLKQFMRIPEPPLIGDSFRA
jgi:hypothetical protein